MKTLELTSVERINLRTSEHIQFATTEHLKDQEKVMINKVGICIVKTGGIKGLVKLKIVQKQWMYSKEGDLIKMPLWALV